jgi:glycosyltransferase involved in cell wall biosynthesis
MRVLLVRSPAVGGIRVHVDALADALRAAGHQPTVLEAAGSTAIPAIRRAARQADVVHAHGLRAGAAACVAVGKRRRLVVTVHNAVNGHAAQLLTRVIVGRADVILAASQDLVDSLNAHGADGARFAPVAVPEFPAGRERSRELREEFGAAEDTRLVLAVGRLAAQKDYPTLIGAAARTRKALFLVAGEGPLRSELQAAIDAVDAPVRLLGAREDVPDLLASADAFVMASTWEARPLALQEALTAGVPSVATAVGGVPGLVGDAALLVPPGDPAALAEALVEVLESPARREALRAAMPGRVAGWPGPADELAAVLEAYGS